MNIKLIALLVLTAALLVTGCTRIETGQVGVHSSFTKEVSKEELDQGIYFPLFTLASIMPFSIKEIEVAQENMRPKAKDNLTLQDLDVSVFYRVQPTEVAEQRIKYTGMHPERNGVRQPSYGLVYRYTRGAVYDIVGRKYESLSIHSRRNELEVDIKTQIQSDLDKSDPGVFDVTKVVVRQMVTDPTLEKAIQEAVRVQKRIEAKKQELELAKAEAARKIVEAQGQADSNKILASSLTDRFLAYKKLEVQQAFAQEGTHTVIMDGNSTPLINVGKR